MGRKTLILSIIIVLFLAGTALIYWRQNIQNIRKEVLGSLKESLEFCEIVKDNINIFSRQGEFWLICNGRPFYAIYENGELKTELNGWSFLKKDQDLWEELENCDFYDSRDSELIFYCPKDFYSPTLTAKSFSFDEHSLKIKKLEEKNFLEIIGEDVVAIYDFLSKCKIGNFDITQYGDYPVILWLTFNCDSGDYVVATDLATVPLQPPILLGDLSYEERARTSFEKSFNFPIESLQTEANQVVIHANKFGIRYIFSDPMPRINYNLKEVNNEDDAKMRIKEFGNYFILPPIERIETIDFIEEIYEGVLTFKINNKDIISVSWAKPIRAINAFWKKTEGINR